MSFNPALLAGLQDALLHSLWHGLLVAIFLAVGLRVIPAAHAERRYGLAVACLAGFLFLFMAHWSYLGVQASISPERHVIEPVVATAPVSGEVPTDAATSNPPISAPNFERASEDVSRTAPPWLLYLWATGAVLMLLRMIVGLRGVRALVRASRPTEDLALAAIFEELRAALGVTARVALRISTQVAAPVAVGLLWPTVVLPASLLSGIPTAHVRALLAHELAHIRRYDYLVNFLQLLAEAAFYFNPALWWISRQIRIEREACCDALAARHAGSAIDYAVALVAVARQVGTAPTLALAADGGDPAGVPERARRILLSTYRPALHCRWYSLAAGLAIVLALGGGLYTGTHAAADAMVTYLRLNDAERVEYLRAEKAERDKAANWPESEANVRVSGQILMPDGIPCPEYIRLTLIVRSMPSGSSYSYGLSGKNCYYSMKVISGDTFIQVSQPGYASMYVGPFQPGPDKTIHVPDIALQASTPWRVRLEDPEGIPIPDAKVGIAYEFEVGSSSNVSSAISDASGWVTLDQSDPPVNVILDVDAKGFESAKSRTVLANAAEPRVVRLKRSVPLLLRVARGSGGPPAEDLAIYLVQVGGQVDSSTPAVEYEVQPDGLLKLLDVPHDMEKLLVVRDPAYGSAFVQVLARESNPVDVTLEERFLEGTLVGDLSSLETRDGQIGITAYLTLSVDHNTFPFARDYFVPVEMKDGKGHFRISGMVPGYLNLRIGELSDGFEYTVSRSDYTYSLGMPDVDQAALQDASTTRRKLRVVCTVPEGIALPNGDITLERLTANGLVQFPTTSFALHEGIGEMVLTTPYEARLNPSELAGYRVVDDGFSGAGIDSNGKFRLESGESPMEVRIALEPAGAIRCEVVSQDGVPEENLLVTIADEHGSDLFMRRNGFSSTDAQGIAWLRGLKLDQHYKLTFNTREGERVREVDLTRAEPIAKVRLELPPVPKGPPMRDVRVSVLDPDGIPLNQFRVLVSAATGENSIRHGMRGSDALVLNNIVKGVTYTGIIAPAYAYAPVPVTITPADTDFRVQAKPGRVGDGRVILLGPLTPIADVEVECTYGHFGAISEVRTDAQGRFRFTNLPEELVQVQLAGSYSPQYMPTSDAAPRDLAADGSTVLYMREKTPEERGEVTTP